MCSAVCGVRSGAGGAGGSGRAAAAAAGTDELKEEPTIILEDNWAVFPKVSVWVVEVQVELKALAGVRIRTSLQFASTD